MSEQKPVRPIDNDDREGWLAYWGSFGEKYRIRGHDGNDYVWRTGPEIDEERKQFLAERRSIQPDIERGIFPFKGIMLDRADVEWLLTTHESGDARGPIDWKDENQRQRHGVDLRGALLQRADLSKLPLARVKFGMSWGSLPKYVGVTEAMTQMASARLDSADLFSAHLEGAACWAVSLEGAMCSNASMHRAEFCDARLAGAILEGTNLDNADLYRADLRGVYLRRAHLSGAQLSWARLNGADLEGAHLEGAKLQSAAFNASDASEEEVRRINAVKIHQSPAYGSDFTPAYFPMRLSAANLQAAYFDSDTDLRDTKLGDRENGSVALADTRYGTVNLSVVDWESLGVLGDERVAWHKLKEWRHQQSALITIGATNSEVINAYETAVRANRQLATVLRSQGLSEAADLYAYRARVLHRQVVWQRALWRDPYPPRRLRDRLRDMGDWLWSWVLSMLAGYGYKPLRSLVAYIVIILAFTGAYLINAQFAAPHLTWDEALVLSISSFHGRGFFTSGVSLGDTLARLAAGEAIIGLLIEITFIATFTQRFFAR